MFFWNLKCKNLTIFSSADQKKPLKSLNISASIIQHLQQTFHRFTKSTRKFLL